MTWRRTCPCKCRVQIWTRSWAQSATSFRTRQALWPKILWTSRNSQLDSSRMVRLILHPLLMLQESQTWTSHAKSLTKIGPMSSKTVARLTVTWKTLLEFWPSAIPLLSMIGMVLWLIMPLHPTSWRLRMLLDTLESFSRKEMRTRLLLSRIDSLLRMSLMICSMSSNSPRLGKGWV